MPYHKDVYSALTVIDSVDHPIFSNTYTPKLAWALEFSTPTRSWSLGKSLNSGENAFGDTAW
jgi:hypothetical protein